MMISLSFQRLSTFGKQLRCFDRKRNLHHVSLGNLSSEREVPDNIKKPDYYYKHMKPGNTLGKPEVKTFEQIKRIKSSCKLAAEILNLCTSFIKEGITTDDIDAFVHSKIISSNAYPSPLRYAGFPKSVCTSVNEVACHGIPDDRKLLNGDIINVDITVFYNGYHGDCSKTFAVGSVSEESLYLMDCTSECLEQSIKLCGPGVKYSEIGCYISKYVEDKPLSTIPSFIGHGIGTYFHGPPEIWHHHNSMPGEMEPGITFTIEPILTLGSPEIKILDDGWTAVSTDGARSAQFEHTILITENGVEVLTELEK